MNSEKYVPTAVGFERANREPLDRYETFNSVEELKDYVSNGAAYQGQICKINFADGLTLQYLIKKLYNKFEIEPLYPMENIKMSDSEYEKYGYIDSSIAVSNTNDSVSKWLLVYDYEASYNWTYVSRNGYEMAMQAFSTLCNLELYNNNGINLLIAINGEVKYKWKQNFNFMLSDVTSSEGANIQYVIDNDNYVCPLVVDGVDTGYGLFPKVATTDYISLYVGV